MTDHRHALEFPKLREYLERQVSLYNHPSFIEKDPISIPHRFQDSRDIEISGFFAAIFAWGQRKTIINKSVELMGFFDHAPHQFIIDHEERDLIRLNHFKHRTFQPADLLYFIKFLRRHYQKNSSLESAFTDHLGPNDLTIESALNGFYHYFFSLSEHLDRTKKHIAAPWKRSTCKRLCMYLRWMVRRDKIGVDFGLWRKIKPSQLCIPLDVHVERVARRLDLIKRNQRDWLTVLELSQKMRDLDSQDPAKYDFALFGISVAEKKPG